MGACSSARCLAASVPPATVHDAWLQTDLPSIELDAHRLELILLSDVDDAMTLELWEARPEGGKLATGDVVLQGVRYDATGDMDVSAYRESLPVSLVEYAIALAKEALPPKTAFIPA